MINRDGLEEDFEKIKDHTKNSPRKWKVLSDTLSSMYYIDKARAVEMWEYIIKNNEDAVRSGDTSYTINLLRRLSYEDNHKPMKEYEIVNFISESSIIFKSIFLYGDLNYGGHLANDYIIRLIKLGKSELAQTAYGYRLLNMNNVDNAMVKKIIDNLMVLIKSHIIEGTLIYYDGFDKFLEYAQQNASETLSQMIEVFLLLVKSDDERSQIEGIQNKLSALSAFFKQTPFSRAAYEFYLLTQNMLLTVTDHISAQAVLDDCIDYMKNVRSEGHRKSDLENHIFERHLKIVPTNAKALEFIFQSSNNDIADIIIFTVLVEKEWGTLNRIIAIVKQFSEASYYYINYLSSVIDMIENNCEKADKEYLVGAYCKILLDHEFDLSHYKIDEKIEEMFCKPSAVIISESNVNLINTNLDKEISKWKDSYEKLGRNLDTFVPSGNIEQDVTSIINLSLTLLKNHSTTDLDTKIYKLTKTLLAIYEKCRYLDTNYDLDYQKNSSLEKKYNDREMLKFYLLRIAFLYDDYDMMDTIFLDMRKYLGDKEVAIRNISVTLESKVERL